VGSVLKETNQAKKQKLKLKYKTGPEARQNFEETMKTLFRAPKIESKKSKKGKG
jgi:hypothetical protein